MFKKILLMFIIMLKKLLLMSFCLNIIKIYSFSSDYFIFYVIDNDIKNITSHEEIFLPKKNSYRKLTFPFIKISSINNKEKKRKSSKMIHRKMNNIQHNLNYLPVNKTKY